MKNLGQYVFDQIQSSQYFKFLTEKLIRTYSLKIIDNKKEWDLSLKEQSDLYRFIDLMANSDIQKARMKAYHLISMLEIFLNNTESFKFYSAAVYSKLGLYALNFEDSFLPFDRKVELETKKYNQKVEDGYILTDTQYDIYNEMIKAPHFSFSGPTSLGKSFIIRRYIKKIVESSNSNIVVLVPSKALINQFSLDIKLELGTVIESKKYVVLTHGNITDVNVKSNYIFVLTPERLLSLYSKNKNIRIDFLFCDEAHKLSNSTNGDVRSLTAYSAIDKTLERFDNVKLVFSSPNIANPEIFLELFNKEKIYSVKVDEAPVSQNLYLIDFKYNQIEYLYNENTIKLNVEILKTVRNINQLIYKIGKNNDSNMVYCSSKEKAITTALEFYESMEEREIYLSEELKDAIEKISSFVHEDYYLTKFLNKRIAYHHGQLPHVIRNIIEKLFREGEINFIFCTPTLVEGVNMPTKNIFINCDRNIRLSKDKTFNPNKTIAFWNLAGRAGRYRKELSGNIFCIQKDNNYRWDDLAIFDKSDNNLLTSIDKKIYNQKSLDKLQKSLLKNQSSSESEDKVLEYLKNLLSIDILRFNDLNRSFILKRILDFKRDDVLEVIKSKTEIIENIPLDILDSFKSLDFEIHKRVFDHISLNHTASKLPKLEYENVRATLLKFYDLYSWEEFEKSDINSRLQIDYYSTMMTKWVSGQSLNSMIDDQLRRTKNIKLDRKSPIINFDRQDLVHVNFVIDGVIYTIERVLTFIFEKYFNHYHKVLCYILGEDNAGHNWSTYLEYGTQNHIEIGLQNLGLSRHTSHIIVGNKKLLKCVLIDENTNDIQKVDKYSLLEQIDNNSLEYEEIISVLL